MKKLNIGGVPEHFNLPWLDAIEHSAGRLAPVRWVPQPQGTGAMVEGLGSGSLDAALLLTEGAVAALTTGGAFEIAGTWVDSPLLWGIHVPADSDIADEASIQGRRYAISRRGSGSHLMSFAHARARGFPLDALEFVVVGTIEGARAAFAEGSAEVFFWEHFMTAPLVDAGEFRRVGNFAAPWPAFVLCIADTVAAEDRAQLEQLLETALAEAHRFASDPDAAAERLFRTYGIEPDAAAAWLQRTHWAAHVGIDPQMLNSVADALYDAGIVSSRPRF